MSFIFSFLEHQLENLNVILGYVDRYGSQAPQLYRVFQTLGDERLYSVAEIRAMQRLLERAIAHLRAAGDDFSS